MRRTVRFVRKGRVVELQDVHPTMTVLDYLRLRERATGTKEGCGEGDCGACTVAVGRLKGGSLVYEPINACIQFVGMLDGKELVSVEDLSTDGTLHPVQQAMADLHGSQCGFCTPGFVMSLFTLYHAETGAPDRKIVNDWISGNLCRCTGYRPIIDAALTSCFDRIDDAFAKRQPEVIGLLKELSETPGFVLGDENEFFAAPTSVEDMAQIYDAHPDATLVSGATDVGLWVTKQLRDLPKIIWMGSVAGLNHSEMVDEGLLIGATATYADTVDHVASLHPDLGRLWRRIGSRQVRASGTVGGNIANGSPIGDTPPALIALDARLELQRGESSRTLPLEEFFLDYGKQDRQPGEFVTGIFVPNLRENQHFRCFKISKRFDQDISALMAAIRITCSEQRIEDIRIAYGGMAGIPKRAKFTEDALKGAKLDDPGTWSTAISLIARDFSPLTDMRASADYRLDTARALLVKALMEFAGTPQDTTRLPIFNETYGQSDGKAIADAV